MAINAPQAAIASSPLVFEKLKKLTSEGKLNDLLRLDKTLNCNYIAPEIIKCMRVYQMSLQEIETFFRLSRCNTGLVALDRDKAMTSNIQILDQNGVEKRYYLYISCGGRSEEWKNTVTLRADYQENFQKLGDTGLRTLK